MAQANKEHCIVRPLLQVKPLNQYWSEKDLSESIDSPFVSVTKLEPRRNDLQYTGSKPKSSPPNQEPTLKDLTDNPINQETGLNTRGCLKHQKKFLSIKTCEDSCRHCVSVFTSVKEAFQTLSREGLCETPLVCLENVFKSISGHIKSVNIADVKKLMNRSQSDIQKQHQENFEAELRKRLQRKSPVENIYKDSSMEDTADRCLDVYCDTPVKQNPTGKGKAKGRKKAIDGQSPKASPVKQSTAENCVAGNVEASDGTNDHGVEEDKQVKGKKKGKGSPSKKSKTPVVDTLFGDNTNSTPEKQVTKKRKPKVKIDHGTPDIEISSTSYTPSPDSSNKKSSLKLSASGLCTPSLGKELHIQINHNDSAHSSASPSKDSLCLEPADSPSRLSPSKELGRRIRAPNMRYSDDILLLPLKSPRRSRSPKGSAEKEGFPGTPEDSPREGVSPEKGKKSEEGQSSQLYSLLTNKAQSNKVVIEKPVSDHKQSNIDTSLKEKDTSPKSSHSKASPLTNGVVDGLETKSEKSSEKTKKKRKKKTDKETAEAPKPKSTAKSEKKLESPQKIKSPKSGAVRVLQFDENEEKTEKLLPAEDKTVKPKASGKGKKIATPKKPKKTTEKGKKAVAKSSPGVLESSSMNQSADTSELSESRSGSVNTPATSAHSAENSASKSFNLFSLIAKVKDNMSSVTFPEFADEVLLIAEEEDTSKEDLNESSENNSKAESENAEYNPDSSEIVDDFFSADFLKVSPKRLVKSPSREAQNYQETNVNEESSSKQSLAKLENIQMKKNVSLDTVNDDTVTSSTSQVSPIQTKTLDGTAKKDDCIKNSSLEVFDEKKLEESSSSIDPTAPLMIDTQERRNIFDAIMTDYPSPNNVKENSESSEKEREKSEMDEYSSSLQANCDNKTISPKVNDNLSISLQGDKSIIEKIQVKLGIPVEECSEQLKSNSKCDSPKKMLDNGRSPTKPIPLPVKKRVPSSALDEEKEHNSTKGSSDFEIVMDTVDDQPLVMEMDSDSTPSPPPDERAGSARPVPRMSTQRVTKEPAPLSVLSSVESEVKDKMCAFTSTSLNKYLDTKTNRKVKLSRPVKLNDSEERLVEDSEDEIEDVTEMPEQYNEFSGMIEQCEPSFDEVDGVLFTSFFNEEALNAHVKVERKSKIGKNESILLGMARMRNLRERQNQIRNSVHQKKDARLKALKEQYKINQSLQGMHLVLMKYQRLFKRELILQLMAKEQESPGSIRGKTPKKTSDITQIKGWKHKFGADDDSLDMKANMGKLHWRTEERLLRNHDPEKLKQMGLELKKKRRKNLVFTIRKGMSKGDPSKGDKMELAAQADEEGNIMEGEVERLDGESSIGQELIEMGYEIIDSEKQKLRDKKQREKYKKYLMIKLKLNSEDIDILKKLGGQRLRSALKSESPKKLPPPRPPTSQGTEDGDKDGENTKDSTPESPSKKKRKRKKNYFNIITLNSSMANAAVSALHSKFVVKKKKAKAVKAIKLEPVDPDFDEKEKKQIEDEAAGNKAEKKTEEKKDADGQMKEVFDKMCDKPDDCVMLFKGGCRYGCICHLCRFSGESSEALDKKNAEKKCTKEYCRLGCICDDSHEKVGKQHCGKPECMIECTCEQVPSGRNSRSSSQGERLSSGGNSEDNQSNPPEEISVKKGGKKNEIIPRRKSTYRLAKNLDAVSRKAMLVYEASEKYETQKTRNRRKQEFGDGSTYPHPDPRPLSQASSIPVTPVTTLGSSLQRKPPLTLVHNTVPIQPKPGGVPISVPQPKIGQPIQSELLRRFTETIKPQRKSDDTEMALFDSDSDGEDVHEVYSCARVDAHYYRGSHPKKCTCGKDHIQSRAVSSQCLPQSGGGQSASSGLSALQQRLTGKHLAEAVWQTQWVCLKSNKPPTENEGQAVKLLEILSNCNWEPHKQKILSRISRQISQVHGDGHTLADGYPPPCLIHIGEFEIEFLPKSSKPATIPPEVRNNMPSAIFSIRVRISLRDLNFPKLFKALPLACTPKTKTISRTVTSLSQNVNVTTSSESVNKSGMNVTGISGFSRLQINKHSIQKDVNSSSDRSHLHPFSAQQMSHMKPSQLLTSIQTLTTSVPLQSSGVRTLAPNTVTLSKVLPAGPTASPTIIVSSTVAESISTTSLISARIHSSVSSSAGKAGTSLLQASTSASASAPQQNLVINSERPSLSVPCTTQEVKSTAKETETISTTDAILPLSSSAPVPTHLISNPINVIATSVVTVTTSVTTGRPVTAVSVEQRAAVSLIRHPLNQAPQTGVNKTTLASLQSVLQNKAVSSSTSSTTAAKPLTTPLSTPVLPTSTCASEVKVPGNNNAMQVHDLRPPASLSIAQVQEKVCVLGPKSSPVTLLGPFTSPSSIPKVLPQMKIVQSSVVDKDGKPVIHLVPFTGAVCGKTLPMTTVIKSLPVGNAGGQQADTTGVMKNPTNVYTLSDVSTTTTNVAHISNASTTVTQSTAPAMSEKVQGPMLPQHGDQILLVSSDENNIKLLNKLKKNENRKNPSDNSIKAEESKKVEYENNAGENIDQSSVSVKRKLDDEPIEERKKVKTSDNEDKKLADVSSNVKDSDSVLAKILMSDEVKETYTKYRDIKADNVRNEGEIKQEVSSETNSSKVKENLQGSIENIEKTHDADFDSDCGSPDNRRSQNAAELDSSCDKSDESDATVVGGIDAEQKEAEVGKIESNVEKSTEDQATGSKTEGVYSEKDHPEVIHILDSPVKKPFSKHNEESNENIVSNQSDSLASSTKETLKRRLSQEAETEGGKKPRTEEEDIQKMKTEENAEENEEELCMTVEDTDDMAVIIPNEDCVEIVNSSDDEVDIETEIETSMNKLLRKQSDTAWEFFNPNCNVHCISKKPHAKRKTNLQAISNSFRDEIHFKEGVLNDDKKRKVQQKKAREKQRREDMRQAFKTLAESMYGEDRDNTKYSEILNHTEPKVQLLNKAKEKISQMEEMSRLMMSENQSSQARNTLLKDRLQNLKEHIIKERGMPWMVLQAHLDKIAKVCKKIFQNMPAIRRQRAMERRASAGSPGSTSKGNQQVSYKRSGILSRPSSSATSTATNGPVPIQMVSSEQVRTMARHQEMARARENIPARPDIYIDYAEEENEICEDILRREEKKRRKQIHDVNINDDLSFEIGDLPNLFRKSEYTGGPSFVDSNSKTPGNEVNISETDDDRVIIADNYDDSGKKSVYRLNSSNPVVEVPMNNSGKIAIASLQNEALQNSSQCEDSFEEGERPMLVISEVKSLSDDS